MNKLVEYLTMACTSTGQATFYNAKKDQDKALGEIHGEMLRTNRRVYALSAVLPINDKSRQLIMENLLGTGKFAEDSKLEGGVIGYIVSDMQFNRVLNLLMTLREKKVNNSRTRNLGKLVWSQVDAYRAIKYATKLRTILRHCHIAEGTDPAKAELHRWLFGKIEKAEQVSYNPKLVSRLTAKQNYAAVFDLPYDIARDIAINIHKKKPEEFDREFSGRAKNEEKGVEEVVAKGTTTRKESMRARKVTGDSTVDFSRFGLYELLMHAHQNPGDTEAVMVAVKRKAKEIAGFMRLPPKVALVVDNSVSALGSAERRFQPLVTMEAVTHVFSNCEGTDTRVFYVGPEPGEGELLKAEDASNIRLPLVKALMTKPDVVVILSDGYENVRAGSVSQILASKAVKNSGIHVLHLNPVAAVEVGKTRELAKSCVAMALPDPERLPMVALLGIAAANPAILEPMFQAVEEKLKLGDFRGVRHALKMSAPVLTVGEPVGTGV